MSSSTSYDVSTAWPAEEAKSVDDCFKFFLARPPRETLVCHGVHRGWPCLNSMLDVRLAERNAPRDQWLLLEQRLLEEFVEEGVWHLEPGARRHIEDGRLKWGTVCHTGTVFASRHFGLPTRAIDWTRDPRAALFFACRRAPRESGVVWWVHGEQLHDAVATQWSAAYGKGSGVEDDFDREFSSRVERDVLTTFAFPPYMTRAIRQAAFVMIGGRLGVDHARALHELHVTRCGRMRIPASMKRPILQRLDYLGLNGHTLDLGGSTCETVAADIAASVLT